MKLQKKSIRRSLVLIFLVCFMLPGMANAFGGFGNSHHVRDGKAFFDMNSSIMDESSLPFVLHGILVTYQELEGMDIVPDFVVIFRGVNTGILTYANTSDEVREMISMLTEMGVQIQVCAKANYLSGVSPDDIVDGIEIVDNAWISSMQLQNKRRGYAYITF